MPAAVALAVGLIKSYPLTALAVDVAATGIVVAAKTAFDPAEQMVTARSEVRNAEDVSKETANVRQSRLDSAKTNKYGGRGKSARTIYK